MTLAKQLLSQNPYLNYVRCAHSLTRKPVGVPALLSPLEETPAFPYPLDLLRYAVARAHWTEDGSAAEFGVYQGASLRYIANQVPGVTVYGFDSFRGLPKAWNGFPAGTFTTKVPPITKNTLLVIGWFNETLPFFVEEMRHRAGRLNFVHVDSDLYESARDVLKHIEPLLSPFATIVFDEFYGYPDWLNGEYRALKESGIRFHYIGRCAHGQQAAIQVLPDRISQAAHDEWDQPRGGFLSTSPLGFPGNACPSRAKSGSYHGFPGCAGEVT